MTREIRRTALWMLSALAGLIATSASATDLLAGSRRAECDIVRVEADRANGRWALSGTLPEATPGRRIPATLVEPVVARLAVPSQRPRTLQVIARAPRRPIRLRPTVNGRQLPVRRVGKAWSAIRWELPADLVPPGPVRVRLDPRPRDDRPRRRPSRLLLRSISLAPVEGCAVSTAEATAEEPAGVVRLEPGNLLVTPAAAGSRVDVRLEGRYPMSGVSVFCESFSGGRLLAELEAGRSLRLRDFLELPPECSTPARLVVAANRSGPVRLTRLELVTPGRWGWRAGLRLLELAAAVGLAALLWLGARRAPVLPLDRYAPWLDVAAVVLLALAVRLLFLSWYPVAEAGDTWGYLRGARRLAQDWSGFWSTVSWHSWNSYIRPPGYYAFLAGVLGPAGGDRQTVVLLQALFSAAGCGATYLMAYPLFGRGAAWAAGLLMTFYLESLVGVPRLLSEPLYMLFLLPALAALAWASRRPSWPLAAVSGALFGLAALVRPGPFYYVPLAALLLLLVHGPRRGRAPAVALVLALAAAILPWNVRNGMVYGHTAQIEDVSLWNLLYAQPEDRFFSTQGFDLETPAGKAAYGMALAGANVDGRLTRQRREIVLTLLGNRLRDPRGALADLGENLSAFFSPSPEAYLRWVLGEHDRYRVAALTDLLNAQFLLVLAAGGAGLAWELRRRHAWPLALWVLFNLAVLNLLFYFIGRYRFGVVPALAVFAGALLAAAGRRIGASRRGGADWDGAAASQR